MARSIRKTSIPAKTRDAEATQGRLIKAVGELLARRGFSALGVNAVAKQAGVDKVLIYRYFGGMPELLRAFGESAEFWPSFDEMTGGNPEVLAARSLPEITSTVLVNFARALRRRPLTQEIMAWETVEQNELTMVLKNIREEMAVKLFKELGAKNAAAGLDVGALTTLIAAGISYLVIRARDTGVFNTVDIGSERGWQRLESAITGICAGFFAVQR